MEEELTPGVDSAVEPGGSTDPVDSQSITTPDSPNTSIPDITADPRVREMQASADRRQEVQRLEIQSLQGQLTEANSMLSGYDAQLAALADEDSDLAERRNQIRLNAQAGTDRAELARLRQEQAVAVADTQWLAGWTHQAELLGINPHAPELQAAIASARATPTPQGYYDDQIVMASLIELKAAQGQTPTEGQDSDDDRRQRAREEQQRAENYRTVDARASVPPGPQVENAELQKRFDVLRADSSMKGSEKSKQFVVLQTLAQQAGYDLKV